MLSPSALLVVFCFFLALTLVPWLKRSTPGFRLKSYAIPGIFPATYFLFEMWEMLPQTDYVTFLQIGMTFYVLKCYALAQMLMFEKEPPSTMAVFLSLINFSTFQSGPIEYGRPFELEHSTAYPKAQDLTFAVHRILLGIFKFAVVINLYVEPMRAGLIADLDLNNLAQVGVMQSWGYSFLSFALVYLNFSGASDLAIGAARLFGIHVRENFNAPFLATNIQDFWRRWHISLGNFVTQYVYVPLIKNFGQPAQATIIVFLAIGLWHALSLQYLIWGLAHGFALVALTLMRGRPTPKMIASVRQLPYFASTISWLTTMIFVSTVSTFANLPSLAHGGQFLLNLIGI